MKRAIGIAVLLALLAGCATPAPPYGPLRVEITEWLAHTPTFVEVEIRLLNVGDEPIWNANVHGFIKLEPAGPGADAKHEEAMWKEGGTATWMASYEVLRPHSFVDRRAEANFTGSFREPPTVARYGMQIRMDYDTTSQGWRRTHFLCDRTPAGEEIEEDCPRGPNAWAFHHGADTGPQPSDAYLVGEPINSSEIDEVGARG